VCVSLDTLGTGRKIEYVYETFHTRMPVAIPVLKTIKNLFRKLTGSPADAPPAAPSRNPEARPAPVVERAPRPRRPAGEPGARPERPPRRRRGPQTGQETGRVRGQTTWNAAEFDVPPEEGKVRFHDLNLPPELMHAIADLGFKYCTPIQAGLLAHTLSGTDATGRAQTGTGKTAAFLITILTRFHANPIEHPKPGTPRALILAPTRELVLQIEKDAHGLSRFMDCRTMAVFGGMEYGKQQQELRGRIDIVAATPGRLLDFRRKGNIDLSKVEVLVIDEADRMLDMGFIPDVRRIVESTPMKGKRQTLFFSATLTADVQRLAASWTRDPVHIDVTPPQDITLSTIDQVVYIITDEEKFTLLYNLITQQHLERVMVFANRRDETQFLHDLLAARGVQCGLLSGDVSQHERVRTLEAFRNGRIKVLVATDVAARGLHIEGVSHVVNFSLPMDPEDYLHRIGRTGRAGATGTSVSFATETEAYEIPEIETFIGRSLHAVQPDPELLTPLPSLPEGTTEPRKRTSRPPSGGQRRGRGGPPRGRRRT
jgi:ATP-dependent RNA helicase RhlB